MNVIEAARNWLTGRRPPPDPEVAAHQAIAAGEAELRQLELRVADVIGEIQRLDKEQAVCQAEVDKYERLKAAAADTGNTDAVRQVIEQRLAAQKHLEAVTDQLRQATAVREQLSTHQHEAEQRLEAQRSKLTLLGAQNAEAKVRTQMAEADLDEAHPELEVSQSPFSATAGLAKEVDDQTARAAAYEQMAASEGPGVIASSEKTVDQVAIEAEVQETMQKHAAQSTQTEKT